MDRPEFDRGRDPAANEVEAPSAVARRLSERLDGIERDFTYIERRLKPWVEGLRTRVDAVIDLEKQGQEHKNDLERQGQRHGYDLEKQFRKREAELEKQFRKREAELEKQFSSLSGTMSRIDKQLAQVREEVGGKGIAGAVGALQTDMKAVIRRLYLEEDLDLPLLHRLAARRFQIASQHEEDGITYALFRWIGTTNRRFVEIGCGTNGGNSGFLAQELGWTGLMIDASEQNLAIIRRRFNQSRVTPVAAWVTRDNVNEILKAHQIMGEIDLLSIDIDGNDYWVWEAIDVCSPRLVIIEYNSLFGGDRAVVVPYDPNFDRHQHALTYFGASLAALAHLARRKGYRLVATESQGVNAYFLRDDIEPSIPACDVAEAYRLRGRFVEVVPQETDSLYQLIAENQLPLIEL